MFNLLFFSLSADTGELWFENALDYEEWCGTNFSATVQACDMGLLGENRFVCLNESWFLERCSDTVTVQACLQGVNDNPPVCPHILKQCIPEQNYSSPSQLQVVRINCTDADSNCPNSPVTPFTYTIDSVVVYEVSDGQQLNPETVNGLFDVDSNGFLQVIGNIDREGREDVHNDEYLVHMTVTDGAPTPHSTTVGVSVWCSRDAFSMALVLYSRVTCMVCTCAHVASVPVWAVYQCCVFLKLQSIT